MAKKRGKPKKLKNRRQVPDTPHISEDVGRVNVPLEVCRLCETEDGPFFNIFSPETTITKKIQELMPFVVTENDDLPNTVCFRCSAQVEVLYEFIQKCINTQKKLRVTVDKRVTSLPETENRVTEIKKWKDSLHKSKVTNDVVCDAVVKKAMEYVIDLTAESDAEKSSLNGAKIAEQSSLSFFMKETLHIENLTKTINPEVESNKKEAKSNKLLEDADQTRSDADRKLTRSTRSNATKPLMNEVMGETKGKKPSSSNSVLHIKLKKDVIGKNINIKDTGKEPCEVPNESEKKSNNNPMDTGCDNKIMEGDGEQRETNNSKHKPFCIMDHVTKIKVNGVGILFQCKLCNRNFMKKEVVFSHGCAKNETRKDFVPPKSSLPQPPKVSTIKYINTKQDNKLIPVSKNAVEVIHEPYHKVEESKTETETIMTEPRTGRASEGSRTKCVPVVGMIVSPKNSGPPKQSTRHQYSKSEERNCNDSKATTTRENSAESSHCNVAQKPEVRARNKTLNQKAQPYPVGLFQASPHTSKISQPSKGLDVAIFNVSSARNQSYTIIQTDNPNKLLISSKPKRQAQHITAESPAKKKRKRSPKRMPMDLAAKSKVTEGARFTFIDVDPVQESS